MGGPVAGRGPSSYAGSVTGANNIVAPPRTDAAAAGGDDAAADLGKERMIVSAALPAGRNSSGLPLPNHGIAAAVAAGGGGGGGGILPSAGVPSPSSIGQQSMLVNSHNHNIDEEDEDIDDQDVPVDVDVNDILEEEEDEDEGNGRSHDAIMHHMQDPVAVDPSLVAKGVIAGPIFNSIRPIERPLGPSAGPTSPTTTATSSSSSSSSSSSAASSVTPPSQIVGGVGVGGPSVAPFTHLATSSSSSVASSVASASMEHERDAEERDRELELDLELELATDDSEEEGAEGSGAREGGGYAWLTHRRDAEALMYEESESNDLIPTQQQQQQQHHQHHHHQGPPYLPFDRNALKNGYDRGGMEGGGSQGVVGMGMGMNMGAAAPAPVPSSSSSSSGAGRGGGAGAFTSFLSPYNYGGMGNPQGDMYSSGGGVGAYAVPLESDEHYGTPADDEDGGNIHQHQHAALPHHHQPPPPSRVTAPLPAVSSTYGLFGWQPKPFDIPGSNTGSNHLSMNIWGYSPQQPFVAPAHQQYSQQQNDTRTSFPMTGDPSTVHPHYPYHQSS